MTVIKCNKIAFCNGYVVNDTPATIIYEVKKCPISVVFSCSVWGLVTLCRVSALRLGESIGGDDD